MKLRKIGNSKEIGSREKEEFRGVSICTDVVQYFYDLYLDLVVYPDGTIIEDDKDELQNALANGDITQKQFDLAFDTCDKLKMDLRIIYRKCMIWLSNNTSYNWPSSLVYVV